MNALVTHQAPVSDLERMAKAFASSKLFGVQNVEQALALMLVAQAEGRHPATAAQDYSIIQGRPSKKADAMLRDFLAAGGKVEWHALTDEQADATFSHPSGGAARIDWTLDRANKAGLGGNAMYKKYPRQMLRSRVVSEGVRTVCPGATSGMYVPEEVQDIVQETVTRVPDAPELPEGVTTGRQLLETQQSTRKIPAQAKRDGDHERYRAMIDNASADELLELTATFDEWTAEAPVQWLDSLRDRMELRREELLGAANIAEDEAALDEAFRATTREGGSRSMAGNDRHSQAAA